MTSTLVSRESLIGLLIGLLAVLVPGHSQAQAQQKGDASLRIEYQYIRTGAYQGETAFPDLWTTDSHVALISGDYALSERWTVKAKQGPTLMGVHGRADSCYMWRKGGVLHQISEAERAEGHEPPSLGDAAKDPS